MGSRRRAGQVGQLVLDSRRQTEYQGAKLRDRSAPDRDEFQKGITASAVNGDFNTSNAAQGARAEAGGAATSSRTQISASGRARHGRPGRPSARRGPTMNQNLKQKTLIASRSRHWRRSSASCSCWSAFLEWRTRPAGRRRSGGDRTRHAGDRHRARRSRTGPTSRPREAAGDANWRFVLNESINSTRTMLLHTARTQSMQVVMVTSATQGEGKTSLASQLATSMATAGMRTLIVDCDLRNPSIHKLFDLPLTPGVSRGAAAGSRRERRGAADRGAEPLGDPRRASAPTRDRGAGPGPPARDAVQPPPRAVRLHHRGQLPGAAGGRRAC